MNYSMTSYVYLSR